MDLLRTWASQLHHILTFELFPFAGTQVTALTLLLVVVMVLLTFQASRLAQRAIEEAARRRGMQDKEGSVAVAQRLAHYSVLVVGAFVGLQTLGIDLGALIAAGAVFAVGIGLAMQNLAQNFVSGVILLVEQSIKPGDIIEVERETLRVQAMGIRSTVCRSREGDELIIPNSALVQNIVRNKTLQDKAIRVRMPVGVHYGSDLARTKEVLLSAARKLPWRMADRDPILLLTAFGSSSVDFEISVWGEDPWHLPQMRTDLAFAVWDALHESGIVISYPQVDVHLDEPVLAALAGGRRG